MSLDKDHWVTRETLLVIFDTALQPEALPTGETATAGVQNELSQNVPLLHENYFELNLIKTTVSRETTAPALTT